MNGYTEDEAFEAAASGSLSERAMAPRATGYLDDLNPEQRRAAETLEGPVLMLAGAGTGKTKALTARITHLLATGTARPNEILAVTFTNKAAREMKDRVARSLGQAVEGIPWLGTFHSICAKLLRRHAELAGLKSNFSILDTDDQLRLLKQLIAAENIDDKRWPPRHLLHVIDQWKNRAHSPGDVPTGDHGAYDGKGVKLYGQYQERLKTLNACDFGDLLLHVIGIFRNNEDVLEKYRGWLRFIHVDEYQDTNVAQYMWLRLLAGGGQGHNICCVGDDDQSIYGWRGAEVGNILKFEKDFPNATVVRLEQNYRSTPHILATASGLIAQNHGRLGKTLWTERTDGGKVLLIGHWDGDEEARWIGEEIEAMGSGTRGARPFTLDEIAILVRTTHQMRAFEDRFLRIGLPYRVIGGPRFYERMEIRDAIAYFRLAVSPDDDLAFERIFNTPKRGLGAKAGQTIQLTARSLGVSLLEGARAAAREGAIKGKGGAELANLVESVDRWHDEARKEAGADAHFELAGTILDESGYAELWRKEKTPEAEGRLENLKELVGQLKGETFQGLLEQVALDMGNRSDDDQPKVSIMTLHGAKGLEFPAVFLPGWEDGLFPLQRAMDDKGVAGLEEERRLAYVGITRAGELACVSFAANRFAHGQSQFSPPSRFIDEMPEEHVEVLTPPGLMGGGHGPAGMGPAQPGEFEESELHREASRADVYNSPGWRRLQQNLGRGVGQPRESRSAVIDLDAVSSFGEGERVFHGKYGYGKIVAIEGEKLEVEFEKAGSKKIVAKYVVPARDAGDTPF